MRDYSNRWFRSFFHYSFTIPWSRRSLGHHSRRRGQLGPSMSVLGQSHGFYGSQPGPYGDVVFPSSSLSASPSGSFYCPLQYGFRQSCWPRHVAIPSQFAFLDNGQEFVIWADWGINWGINSYAYIMDMRNWSTWPRVMVPFWTTSGQICRLYMLTLLCYPSWDHLITGWFYSSLQAILHWTRAWFRIE